MQVNCTINFYLNLYITYINIYKEAFVFLWTEQLKHPGQQSFGVKWPNHTLCSERGATQPLYSHSISLLNSPGSNRTSISVHFSVCSTKSNTEACYLPRKGSWSMPELSRRRREASPPSHPLAQPSAGSHQVRLGELFSAFLHDAQSCQQGAAAP